MGVESTIYDLRNVRAFYLGKTYSIVCALHDMLADSRSGTASLTRQLLAEDTTAANVEPKVELVREVLLDRLDLHERDEWHRQQTARVARFLVEAGEVRLESDSSDFDCYAANAGFVVVASAFDDFSVEVASYESVDALREAAANRSLGPSSPSYSGIDDGVRIARIGDTEEFWFLSERRNIPLYTDKKWLDTYYFQNHVVLDEHIVESPPSGRFNPGTVWRKHPRAFSAVFGSWLNGSSAP